MSLNYSSLLELMPQGEKEQKILDERARYLSHKEGTQQAVHLDYFIRFRLGEQEYYGIPFQYIKEVMSPVPLTRVPNTPKWVSGIFNLNGALISILDLKPFFGLNLIQQTQKTRLIVIQVKDLTCALEVDAIEGMNSFDPKNLEAPLVTENSIKPKYSLGINESVTTILNLETLLSDLQIKN